MICFINPKIKNYIKKFNWSKRLEELINKEVEVDEQSLELFEIENDVYGLEIIVGYEVFCIPLKCLSYYCEELETIE
ncbi:MAG: hypothetical protein ACRCW9_06305 [Cetobacterium sp.]